MTRLALFLMLVLLPLQASAAAVRTVQAPSGVEVWLSEEHSIPMIAVNISLPGGSVYDPPDKPGLAAMTASLLDEGAGDLPSDAFKQALESRAIRFSASVTRDYLVISLVTLRENADEAFRLLALALAHPRFDREAVERMRAQILAGLKQDDEDPGTIAGKAWFSNYFGDHGYAHSDSGTPSSIAAITVQDIRAFAAAALTRGRAKVAAAGDVTEVQLKGYVQDVFLPLPSRTPPAIARPQAGARGRTQVLYLDFPQPAATFGLPGPMRNDAEYIPTVVANYILGGGGFSSRLMDEVRDKRGLTYGISTQVVDYRLAGIILGSVQSDKGTIVSALDVTKAEMGRFASGGATQQELDDAKTYLTGSFALSLDSNAKIAAVLGSYQRAGLTADYVTRRNALIQAVTLAQVNAVAKKYFDPAKLSVVIAGTPARQAEAAPANAPPAMAPPDGGAQDARR